jgi:hypothetical protein
MELWSKCLSHGKLDFFPTLHDFVVKPYEDLNADVLQTMKKHLKGLNRGFHKSFPEPNDIFE